MADISCDAALTSLSAGEAAEAEDIRGVRSVQLVRIEGCVQTLSQEQVTELRAIVQSSAVLSQSVEDAGLLVDDLVGGNVEGSSLTLYFDTESDAA